MGSMRPCSKYFPTYQPNYLWVFIFRVAEKGFLKVLSCLIKIFFSASYNLWKGVSNTITKKFSNLSTKIVMGFYFWKSREKGFLSKNRGFMNHITMQLYIYLDNPDTQSGPSVLVVRSSLFGPLLPGPFPMIPHCI